MKVEIGLQNQIQFVEWYETALRMNLCPELSAT